MIKKDIYHTVPEMPNMSPPSNSEHCGFHTRNSQSRLGPGATFRHSSDAYLACSIVYHLPFAQISFSATMLFKKILANSPFTPHTLPFLLLFSPLHLVFSCIPCILLDICVLFLTLPHSCPPPSILWNASLWKAEGFLLFSA